MKKEIGQVRATILGIKIHLEGKNKSCPSLHQLLFSDQCTWLIQPLLSTSVDDLPAYMKDGNWKVSAMVTDSG